MGENSYVPRLAVIDSIGEEAAGIRAFGLRFKDEAEGPPFTCRPGQFVELTVFGVGEAPISVSGLPNNGGRFEVTVAAVGEVTEALHEKVEGDLVGVRGPYGNGFPLEDLAGRDLLVLAGGIGLAPLRSLVTYALANRDGFGRISVLYGAREPSLLCFQDDLDAWAQHHDAQVLVSVDVPCPGWQGGQGPATALLSQSVVDPAEGAALVCGPPVMISVAAKQLLAMGFSADRVITSLERRMECGVGKCGHCSVGGVHVCTNGPVFNYARLMALTEAP